MGATASAEEEVIGGVRTQRIPVSRSSWRTRKNFVLAKWQKREQQSQAFGVVRHAERADSVYGLYQGARWTQTEDFHKYPMDPPLSDVGLEAAFEETAQRIAKFSVENNARIAIVVTSPYFRCVQTAVEVCRALGPGVRLLIDNSLGEVYGPAVMGEREPISPTRPMDQIVYYCKSRGVKCISKVIGRWPEWPEDLQAARRRYADRFLTFLQRSTVAKRNFVLVTHGDCVGATVTMMPSQGGSKLEKVEYGGMFLAKRKDQRANSKGSNSAGDRAASCGPVGGVADGRMHGVLPTAAETDEEPDEEAEIIDNPRLWKEVSKLDKPMEDSWMKASGDAPGAASEFLPPEPPKASDGWQVEVHDLVIRPKSRKSTAEVFTKKVTSLVKNSKFSREQIERLLGDLTDKPLGDTDETINNMAAQQKRTDVASGRTSTNYSTLIFGASEIGTQSEFTDACSEQGGGSESRFDSFTNESFDQYMSLLKGQRRRPIRPKTQSSQPKTPKFPAMARTDEMAPNLSDDMLRGSSASRADELVAGALVWSDLEAASLPSRSYEADIDRAAKLDPAQRSRTLSRGSFKGLGTPQSPRSPRSPLIQESKSGGADASDDSAWSSKRSLTEHGQLHSPARVSTSPEAMSGSGTGSRRNILSVAQLMAQHQQQVGPPYGPSVTRVPSGGIAKEAAPAGAAAPVLGGLQNSALMKRRGLETPPVPISEDPPRQPSSAEAVEALRVEPQAGASERPVALGCLQNSLLMRRRGPGALQPLEPSTSPPARPSLAVVEAAQRGAEKAAPFSLQNSKLLKRRSMDAPGEPAAALAPLQIRTGAMEAERADARAASSQPRESKMISAERQEADAGNPNEPPPMAMCSAGSSGAAHAVGGALAAKA